MTEALQLLGILCLASFIIAILKTGHNFWLELRHRYVCVHLKAHETIPRSFSVKIDNIQLIMCPSCIRGYAMVFTHLSCEVDNHIEETPIPDLYKTAFEDD